MLQGLYISMRKAGVYVYEIMEPTHANTELLAYLPLVDGQSINESSEKKYDPPFNLSINI